MPARRAPRPTDDVADTTVPPVGLACSDPSPSSTWSETDPDGYLLNTLSDFGNTVPVDIAAYRREIIPGHAPTRYLTEWASQPYDASTGETNNSGEAVVGLRLTNRRSLAGTAPGSVATVDAGDVVGSSNVGTSARFIPLLIDVGNPVSFNTSGTPETISNYAAIVVTNQAIQPAGSGTVNVKRSVLQQWEGAPDTGDPEHVKIGKKIVAAFLNDTVEVGHNLQLGVNQDSDSYFQITGGGEPAVAPPGTARIKYQPGANTLYTSVDNTAWRPLGGGVNYIKQYDPDPQDYPANGDGTQETTIFESFPNDGFYRGFSAFEPHTFRLPARVAIAGGYLVPAFRLVASTGSSMLFKTNNTDADFDFGRDGTFMALGDTWITSIKYVVINTSPTLALNADVGNFIAESTLH